MVSLEHSASKEGGTQSARACVWDGNGLGRARSIASTPRTRVAPGVRCGAASDLPAPPIARPRRRAVDRANRRSPRVKGQPSKRSHQPRKLELEGDFILGEGDTPRLRPDKILSVTMYLSSSLCRACVSVSFVRVQAFRVPLFACRDGHPPRPSR